MKLLEIFDRNSKTDNVEQFTSMLEKFFPIAVEELTLTSLPKFSIHKALGDPDYPSFGGYDFENDVLYVAISGRHPVDILRTIAHELVHYSQNLENGLSMEDGITGSEKENQANAVAGVILRKFNKAHPEYLSNKPLIIEQKELDNRIINENLRKWFKEKWVRFGPDGKIRGACARGSKSEGKPKCLPQSKAHALGKKGRASAASRKRRQDPDPERKGSAINVKTEESHLIEAVPGTTSRRIRNIHEQALPELKAELVEIMPPWDFEVAVYNPRIAQKEHYIIRPNEMWEWQLNRLQIITADMVDLQKGNSFFVELESAPNEHYERVFEAIVNLFWNDDTLNRKLFDIIKYSQDNKTIHKPLPGVVRLQNTEIPADEFIKGANAEKELMSRLRQGGNKGVAEGVDYMAGHCHVMAIALKQLHPDWQIRAHIGWDEDTEDDESYRIDHVYIVAPDGSAYDCRGKFENEKDLLGPDETGGVETQIVDYSIDDMKKDIARGELKGLSKQDIQNAISFLNDQKKILKQDVAEGSYREGGSITHDGVKYDFDSVMSIAEKMPTKTCSVDKLSWVLQYDTPNKERLERADITVPLIVTKSVNGKLAAIDGLHRLAKAVRDNVKTLPVKYIKPSELEPAKLNKQGVAEGVAPPLPQVLYHGGPKPITKFNTPPQGVYFSPHLTHAQGYGDVVTAARVNANNVYLIDYENDIDEDIMDALFDMDYRRVAKYIKLLQKQGYDAMQSISDSEMVVVFPGTPIQVIDDQQGVAESQQTCPHCGGLAFTDKLLAEKKDACYHKVRSRYKVWPSAYASGALVQCRKKGAANWGKKVKETQVNEATVSIDDLDQILSSIINEKWSAKYKRSINCKNPKGFSQRAHCQGRKKYNETTQNFNTESEENIDENFADGKIKGKSRPGRARRAGVSCKGNITDLRARAKRSTGEKAKMLHWCSNMKSGKKS